MSDDDPGGHLQALERKLAALEERDQQFRSFMRNIPGACYRTDARSHATIFLSDQIADICSYSVAEFMAPGGPTCYGLIHPGDRGRADRIYAEALANHAPFEVEMRFRHKDGSYRWVLERGRGLFDADGGVAFYDGVFVDITERHAILDRLHESEQQFKTLIQNIPGSCYRASAGAPYHLEYLSDTFSEITGYPVSEFVGADRKSDVELIVEDDRDFVRASIDDALAARRPFSMEYRLRHKDGSIRWMLEQGRGVFDEAGTLLHVDGVVFDVTDRVKALDRANAAMEKLAQQERMATIGKVAATVSHELRNPLTAILTSTALLRRRAEGDVVRTLDRIERNVERCTDIITDLLAFTEPEALQREPTAVDDWLVAVLEQQRLPEGIALAKQLSCAGMAAIDRRLLGLAIGNLVENAAAALRDPGWQPPPGHRPTIVVRSETVGANCLVTISDNGPGLGADVMSRAFEPLFTTRGFGVGLGLPIARQIVQQHGGSLTLHNGGAVAIVSLPRQMSAQAAA
jgi:PAS domain S-box-containing protein